MGSGVERLKTDLLIIGGGVTGLCAGIEAAKYGVDVFLVDKGVVGSSGSSPSAGGSPHVFCPPELGGNPSDSLQIFYEDILKGGSYLSDLSMLQLYTKGCLEEILQACSLGVPYLRDEKGRFSVSQTLGESYPRIGKVDKAGLGLTLALRKEALHRGCRFFEKMTALALLKDEKGVKGALARDHRERVSVFQAKQVILAAGSALDLYPFSSASYLTTGDAYALAAEAGTTFNSMEFVEFSIIPAPDGVPISTGGIKPTLAAGAVFYNRHNERFMEKYDPERLELTNRSTLVRAIFTELQEGRGPCSLDASMLAQPSRPLKKAWEALGVNYKEERIPWYPAVHTFLGGVYTNERGETNVPDLLVAGEAAGFHRVFGADRVGGGLGACQFFGTRVGKHAALEALSLKHRRISSKEIRSHLDSEGDLELSKKRMSEYLEEIKTLAWQHIGLSRNASGLAAAAEKYRHIRDEMKCSLKATHGSMALRLRNLALTGELVCRAALAREETRGQHIRDDYPRESPLFLGLVRQRVEKDQIITCFEPYENAENGMVNDAASN